MLIDENNREHRLLLLGLLPPPGRIRTEITMFYLKLRNDHGPTMALALALAANNIELPIEIDGSNILDDDEYNDIIASNEAYEALKGE